MRKLKLTDAIAVISAIGMLGWLITDFFGGMVIWFFSFPFVILPIIILYIVSFFNTLMACGSKGLKRNKIKILAHVSVLSLTLAIILFQSELFKPERIMTARMDDDLFHYTLILRENGTCENEIRGYLGFSERHKGHYRFQGDTIIFSKIPYDTKNFIPDTILIDKEKNAIFIEQDTSGKFCREKKWLNHFEIIDRQ